MHRAGIRAGEELTTNYLHHHYHYYGTSYRRQELAEFWHFECGCARCGDMTEFGSEIDTVQCRACSGGGGGLRRNHRAEADTRWRCECGHSLGHEEVRDILNVNWDMLEQVDKEDNGGLLEVLAALEQEFHPHHYYVLETKRRFMENLVDCEDLAVMYLERKVAYCRDHLEVAARVAPGLSEYRAYVSWHLAEPLYWLAKERCVQQLISGAELAAAMEEVARHLLAVIQIWGPFRRRSAEWIVAEKARTLLQTVDEKYLHRDLRWEAESVLQDRVLRTYRNIESL